MKLQLTAQISRLHVLVSGDDGHAAPPWAASLVTLTLLCLFPSPHVTSHVDHDDQMYSQSFGHDPSLHNRNSGESGQGVPPLSALRPMIMLLIWIPDPHDVLH